MKIKRKRFCRFCEHNVNYIDFKDPKLLNKFTSDVGKIIQRRITGTCPKHQRQLVKAIKRARFMAIVPYVFKTPR